jgi:hypothetical protein
LEEIPTNQGRQKEKVNVKEYLREKIESVTNLRKLYFDNHK